MDKIEKNGDTIKVTYENFAQAVVVIIAMGLVGGLYLLDSGYRELIHGNFLWRIGTIPTAIIVSLYMILRRAGFTVDLEQQTLTTYSGVVGRIKYRTISYRGRTHLEVEKKLRPGRDDRYHYLVSFAADQDSIPPVKIADYLHPLNARDRALQLSQVMGLPAFLIQDGEKIPIE